MSTRGSPKVDDAARFFRRRSTRANIGIGPLPQNTVPLNCTILKTYHHKENMRNIENKNSGFHPSPPKCGNGVSNSEDWGAKGDDLATSEIN